MNDQDARLMNDTDDEGTVPTNHFVPNKWIRRILYFLVALAAFWMIADFVYSRVVGRNLAIWEKTIERHESGIQIGGEPYSMGNESCDIAILMIHGYIVYYYCLRSIDMLCFHSIH